MTTPENVSNMAKPSVEQSIRKIAYHATEGAAEATKMVGNHSDEWMKHMAQWNKYNWKYGRYGRHCGRPGRLIFGVALGAFGGYYFSKNYTFVRKENAEFVPGQADPRHGFWRMRKVEEQPPAEK